MAIPCLHWSDLTLRQLPEAVEGGLLLLLHEWMPRDRVVIDYNLRRSVVTDRNRAALATAQAHSDVRSAMEIERRRPEVNVTMLINKQNTTPCWVKRSWTAKQVKTRLCITSPRYTVFNLFFVYLKRNKHGMISKMAAWKWENYSSTVITWCKHLINLSRRSKEVANTWNLWFN